MGYQPPFFLQLGEMLWIKPQGPEGGAGGAPALWGASETMEAVVMPPGLAAEISVPEERSYVRSGVCPLQQSMQSMCTKRKQCN